MQKATLLQKSVWSLTDQSKVRIIKKKKKKDIHLTRESDNTLCIGQKGLGSLEEKVLKTNRKS